MSKCVLPGCQARRQRSSLISLFAFPKNGGELRITTSTAFLCSRAAARTHIHTNTVCVRSRTSKADTRTRNSTRSHTHAALACTLKFGARTHTLPVRVRRARERATPCLVTTLLELTLCVRMRPSLDQTKPSANVRGFLFYTVYGGFILYIGHAPTVLGR